MSKELQFIVTPHHKVGLAVGDRVTAIAEPEDVWTGAIVGHISQLFAGTEHDAAYARIEYDYQDEGKRAYDVDLRQIRLLSGQRRIVAHKRRHNCLPCKGARVISLSCFGVDTGINMHMQCHHPEHVVPNDPDILFQLVTTVEA